MWLIATDRTGNAGGGEGVNERAEKQFFGNSRRW